MPAAAWAVQLPRSNWFSTGEHHSLKSHLSCGLAVLRSCSQGREFKFLVEGGDLFAGDGIVAEVRPGGEPAGADTVRHARDPYLPAEEPVLHGNTSFKTVPEGVERISNNLNGVPRSSFIVSGLPGKCFGGVGALGEHGGKGLEQLGDL